MAPCATPAESSTQNTEDAIARLVDKRTLTSMGKLNAEPSNVTVSEPLADTSPLLALPEGIWLAVMEHLPRRARAVLRMSSPQFWRLVNIVVKNVKLHCAENWSHLKPENGFTSVKLMSLDGNDIRNSVKFGQVLKALQNQSAGSGACHSALMPSETHLDISSGGTAGNTAADRVAACTNLTKIALANISLLPDLQKALLDQPTLQRLSVRSQIANATQISSLTRLCALLPKVTVALEWVPACFMPMVQALTELVDLGVDGVDYNGKRLAPIVELPNLTRLVLGEGHLAATSYMWMSGLRKLEVLEVSACSMEPSWFQAVAQIKQLKSLSIIPASIGRDMSWAVGLTCCRALSSLTDLEMHSYNGFEPWLNILVPSLVPPNLQRIRLSGCTRDLSKLSAITSLTDIQIGDAGCRPFKPGDHLPTCLTKVTSLFLSVRLHHATFLTTLHTQFPALTKLDVHLDTTFISLEEAVDVIATTMPNLREVIADVVAAGEFRGGPPVLAHLRRLPKLTMLKMQLMRLRDEGACIPLLAAELVGCPNLWLVVLLCGLVQPWNLSEAAELLEAAGICMRTE